MSSSIPGVPAAAAKFGSGSAAGSFGHACAGTTQRADTVRPAPQKAAAVTVMGSTATMSDGRDFAAFDDLVQRTGAMQAARGKGGVTASGVR